MIRTNRLSLKKKFIDYFMEMAELTASLSYAHRLQVGALIVKGNRVIGTGYNGMPTDWENDCEVEGVTKPEVLHAETNAIAKVAQSTESSAGSTLFCTHAPCLDCAKLIYQSGIESLYYRNSYRDEAGVKFLKLGGVNVHHYDTGKVSL